MNLVMAFIAFNLIIIIHELGHFIAAKLADIKVLEFSLFVGPTLFSFEKGETKYSLRLFPILAYVKMEGEEEESDNERAFNKKPLSQRAAVIAAGPLANLFIAIIILAIVFSITGYTTTTIGSVERDSPASSALLQAGDRIVRYDNKRVYQPMDLVQFLYVEKGKSVNIEVMREGTVFKTWIDPLSLPEQERYLFGFNLHQIEDEITNTINSVMPNTPAESAGLESGDKVIKLNTVPITNKGDIDSFMAYNKGEPVKMMVLRNDTEMIFDIVPYAQKLPEQYYLGIGYEFKKGNIFEVVGYSLSYAYSTVRSVGYSLGWLITRKVSLSQMTGPIGIVSTIGEVVEQGTNFMDKILYLLNIMAFISIAIGATNLIPFPALDGNKLLLILIEAIRKKPIPPEKEAFISMIGFVILIILALFTFYNDTLRLIRGG